MPARKYREIERLIRPVALRGAWRIFRAAHRRTPLGVGRGLSRFAAPNGEFRTLYAAARFETAFRETLVRDKYDGKSRRRMAAHTLRRHACVQVDSRSDLLLVDVTDGRAQNYGVPERVRHGADYRLSQEFALDVYENADADGLFYRSRFDDQPCVAVFDRAIAARLAARTPMILTRNPLLYEALGRLRIDVFRWRGLS